MTALDNALEQKQVSPIVELLTLAAPTVAQMLSYTLMQFVDTLMLSRVGLTEATAGGNAGLFSFSVISLGVGVLFVVNTLASQSFGRREFAECGRFLWQGIWFALFASGFFVALIPAAEHVFVWMGHEPRLAADEGIYLRITLAGSVFKLLGVAFGQFLLATDRPGSVLLSTLAGVSVNALAAWMLIFGHGGMPRLGIAGSAWGQNIGVVVESAVLLWFILHGNGRRLYNVLDFALRREQMLTLLRIGIPSGVQIVADVLAWSLFGMWVMGQFGTAAMAAQTYMMRYMVVSFMPAFGVGTAVTALVGRYIGRGEPDVAAARARLGFTLTAIYMLTCGIVFYLGRYSFIRLFDSDPEVLRIGATMLVFAAVYQFFDALYIVYNGALRGAGDTFVPAVATGVLCWGITVFGGYATAKFFPRFGPAGPWSVATGYGVILGLFMYRRFARGGWRSIHLEQPTPADTVLSDSR
jgi:MATE family multidrug resistance protein